MKTIFQQSVPFRTAVLPEKPGQKAGQMLPANLLRKNRPGLPEVSELDVVRHFTRLSHLNYSVDTNFYPLGSCTMKYNAKFMDYVAGLPGFASAHPALAQLPGGEALTQGCLEAMWLCEKMLEELTGMKAFTLQPMAGAQGELAGILLIAAYHRNKGNKKTKVIVPDSAHGTNPATAALAGYEVVNVPSSADGVIDPEALAEVLDDSVAALMMTCPNTLGLFEKHLPAIVEKLRAVDALLYYDGANFNAIMGKMRTGDVGFDVVHLNVHKTLGTPHGGGGPGAGPVGVSERLVPFLPGPRVVKTDKGYGLDRDLPLSIGKLTPYYGNFAVTLRALAYMLRLGAEGLARASEFAVLNANYMLARIKDHLDIPYDRICMHEFVASASNLDEFGVHALDLAKAILDKGYHAPTIYFPLIVKECMMFEPTETESRETLDAFCADLVAIIKEARTNPDAIKAAPVTLPMRRMNETKAARDMILKEE